MKVMETLMGLFFYFLFYFPSIVFPEYVLNLMIFWIRPIYRRLIKIEFWFIKVINDYFPRRFNVLYRDKSDQDASDISFRKR